MACLAIVSSVSALLAFSAARGMPAFEPALRRWGAAMLCIVATAAGLLIRPVLPPALTVALPHLLTVGAVALLASAADALQGPRTAVARAVWWVAGGAAAALLGAQAWAAPHGVVMAIGSGGLALAFGLLGWMLSAQLRLALHSLPAWVLCLSSLAVAAAFALRVALAGLGAQGTPGMPPWLSGHPLLVVGVTFVSIGSQAFFSVLHERQRAALRDVYQRDSLTGLYIRGEFFRRAQAMLQEARPGEAFAVVMVDLDHFKRINDTYGHIVGDRVIAHAARLLQASTRLHDVAGRYGGEEFCLLLRECDAEQASTFARRLLRVAEQPVSLRDGRSIAVTLSVGYLAFEVDGRAPSLELLVDRADQALLRAKAQGRNRAVDAQALDDRGQDVQRAA
jgi:diguanylate cyclase (GGDEF)-like protein